MSIIFSIAPLRDLQFHRICFVTEVFKYMYESVDLLGFRKAVNQRANPFSPEKSLRSYIWGRQSRCNQKNLRNLVTNTTWTYCLSYWRWLRSWVVNKTTVLSSTGVRICTQEFQLHYLEQFSPFYSLLHLSKVLLCLGFPHPLLSRLLPELSKKLWTLPDIPICSLALTEKTPGSLSPKQQ